jgi:GTPase SAR1 family protein
MANSADNNILIIGGPNAGKTHFGGQLYGRLNDRGFKYKISPNNRPTDLTIFDDVLKKLCNGQRADHTEASANRSIELIIDGDNGKKITLSFPDYAGEQVKMIVDTRRVNNLWKEYIDNSTSWLLFVRLDTIELIEDIINRGMPSPEEIAKRNTETPPAKISDAAHFVELLQILLYTKGVSSRNKIAKPNLTIVLSCWDILIDELRLSNDTVPSVLLQEKVPMLYNFIKNNWEEDSLSIIGLSSTEKTLTDKPDDDYIDRTPIDFGYFIDSDGRKEHDLTLSIEKFIGR